MNICIECKWYGRHKNPNRCTVTIENTGEREFINPVTGDKKMIQHGVKETHDKVVKCSAENEDGDCPVFKPKNSVDKPE